MNETLPLSFREVVRHYGIAPRRLVDNNESQRGTLAVECARASQSSITGIAVPLRQGRHPVDHAKDFPAIEKALQGEYRS